MTAALPTTSGTDDVLLVTTGVRMRHGFQRRQAEAFIERREDEDLCLVVKDAQHVDGHEAEEAHIVLHAALHARRGAGRDACETSSPMMMSFRSSKRPSLFSSFFSAANASMMRTTFLCGLMRPAYSRNG